MHISRVSFLNFRNFQSLDLIANQGFVILSGRNGAGKTNFLEGLYYGTSLRKFPESKMGQLFREGETFFKVRTEFGGGEGVKREVGVEFAEGKYVYQFKINNLELTRNNFPRGMAVISFLPQDLNLLTGAPGRRRRFLDEVLTSSSPAYRYALLQYEKALRQRNEAWGEIKKGEAALPEIEIWDERLAEFGYTITRERETFVQYLNKYFANIVQNLSPELTTIRFVYENAGSASKEGFIQKLLAARPKEQELGGTIVGPQRDDFRCFLKERDVVGFLSRGQMRAITLALKILEKQYLEVNSSRSPILLLDDVFSEFDLEHQQKLAAFLQTLPQVFLTTTHLEEVKAFLPDTIQVYTIENGILANV